jgi:hypothetical protein
MTRNNLEIVKNKVRKLLALSKSDNENEAALALKKANEFIEKYALDETCLRFESTRVKSTRGLVLWRTVIANAVSWLYGCYHYRDRNDGMMIFTGEHLYSLMAGEMFAYLIKSIERCAKKSIRKNAKHKFRQSFKYGMATRLYDRIMTLGSACSWAPGREARIEEAAELVKQTVNISDSKAIKTTKNNQAILRGLLYGETVSLARQDIHRSLSFLKLQSISFRVNFFNKEKLWTRMI